MPRVYPPDTKTQLYPPPGGGSRTYPLGGGGASAPEWIEVTDEGFGALEGGQAADVSGIVYDAATGWTVTFNDAVARISATTDPTPKRLIGENINMHNHLLGMKLEGVTEPATDDDVGLGVGLHYQNGAANNWWGIAVVDGGSDHDFYTFQTATRTLSNSSTQVEDAEAWARAGKTGGASVDGSGMAGYVDRNDSRWKGVSVITTATKMSLTTVGGPLSQSFKFGIFGVKASATAVSGPKSFTARVYYQLIRIEEDT